MTTHWLIVATGMIEPEVVAGPFASDEELLEAAKALVASDEYELDEDGDDVLFWLDVTDGVPEIGSFAGGFMDEARGLA